MSDKNNDQELPLGLYWKGKRTTVDRIVLPFQSLEVVETINESRATREKEKGTLFRQDPNAIDVEWRNKLIWGDNKYVMSALLEKYAGKIDLICIDPPFATGANFSTTVEIGDNEIEVTKAASAIEEMAYRDTWGKGLDSFLQMMYDRLVLMRELLSETGSIYVHVDYRTNSYIRCILDEIFGIDNFRNEIYAKRKTKNLQTQFDKVKQLNIAFDSIFWYSKKPDIRFSVPKKDNKAEVNTEQWNNFYNNANRPTLRYPLLGINLTEGQWRWNKDRALKAVENYKIWQDKFSKTITLYEYWLETGESKEFIKRDKGSTRCYYWISPKDEINVDTNWSDFYAYDT